MKKPGLLTRVLQKAFNDMIFPQGRNMDFWLPRTTRDYEGEVGGGDRSSVIMAVMFWIMRRFADSQYKLLKSDEEVEQHDILNLLKKPNNWYSGRLLRMASALSYSMDGNCYWFKIRNKQLKPIGLWYVPHWLIEPHWPEGRTDVYIDYYSYYTGLDTIKVFPDDVIHFRFGLDPYNTRKGMAPLKSLFREVFTDDEAANFTASLMVNMGIPGLIISPGMDNAIVKESDKKSVEEKFNNLRDDKRGRTVVISSKTDVKQFGFTPAQMDLGRLREIPEERVTAVLGVPAAVVGFGTGLQQTKVGATMKEMVGMAYDDCIIPMQNTFSDEIDNQLMGDFESKPEIFRLEFDLSKIRVLQEDENAKAERVRGLVKDLILTQGEGRHELGIESGPEHDVWLLPMSITPTPIADFGLPIESTEVETLIAEQVPHNEEEIPKSFYLPSAIKVKTIGWKLKLIRELNKSHGRMSDSYSKTLQNTFAKYGLQAMWAWEGLVEQRGIKGGPGSGRHPGGGSNDNPEGFRNEDNIGNVTSNYGYVSAELKQDYEIDNDEDSETFGEEIPTGDEYVLFALVYVNPNDRGQGHAGKLLDRAIENTAGTGREIKLIADPKEESIKLEDLVSFYKKHGFNVDDDFPGSGVLMYHAPVQKKQKNKIQTKDNLDELYANLIVAEIGDDIVDYRPHFLRVARETFDTIQVITGMGVALTDANEARIMERGGTRKGLLDIKGDTKKAIMQALGEARELGEGPYKAAMRIREYVGKGKWSSAKIRADVIARTETKYAQNVSSLDAYKSAGCSRVEIVDGQLPTSDEECIARNGQVMDINEAYNLEEHPNGTLSWTPIIEHITMGGES
jgi:HK97 family phage portal protein